MSTAVLWVYNKVMQTECPIERALQLLGRRGALLVVRDLVGGARRYKGLESSTRLPPHTLSQRLKELEESGLIRRRQYGEVPPRVEYSLTTAGAALQSVLEELGDWSEEWLPAAQRFTKATSAEEQGPEGP